MAADIAVSVQHLTRSFGSTVALNDVTFEVPRGSLFGLLGPNGAGKTTLFSVAGRYLRPTAGTVEVLGVDVRAPWRPDGRLTMLPQDAVFAANVAVIDQLVLFARLGGASRGEALKQASDALERVGLGGFGGRGIRTLSHGMGKRVALCQAFLGNPELVFLDEPTAGLDPATAAQIRSLVREFTGDRTVVFSSHNLTEVQELCDHAAILDHGRVLACGPMAQILGTGEHLRITLNKPANEGLMTALRGRAGVQTVTGTSLVDLEIQLATTEHADCDAATAAILATVIEHGFVPRALSAGARLEQRFLEIVGRTGDGLGGS